MATAQKSVKKELNLDEKVAIRSIADWETTFARIDNNAPVVITKRGTFTLPRNEIISQCNNGNRLFTGTDGIGSHATIVIEDAATRIEVGFETEDGSQKQLHFSDALVKEVFAITNQTAFEDAFKNSFVTRAEHYAVIDAIQRLGLNDYKKIRFIEKYTGFSL